MISFLFFIIALSIIIIVHELGHYLVAKKCRVLVYEFGLGYPPRAWGKKIGKTIYSINWFPLGGFVRLLESLREVSPADKIRLKGRDLESKPKVARFSVVIAGVMMNLILAVLIFAVVYGIIGVPQKTDRVTVVGIADDSPAQAAGVEVDDLIVGLRVDDHWQLLETTEELADKVAGVAGRETSFVLAREEEKDLSFPAIACPKSLEGYRCFERVITPRQSPPGGEGPLGVAISHTKMVKPIWWARPFLGVWAGFKEAFFWGKTIVAGLGEMVGDLVFRGQAPTDVAGPVGIFQATSSIQAQSGTLAVIHFFGILSVNLAVINLLPIPGLDGSRLLFLGWEAVTRRKVPHRLEKAIFSAGMALIIFLFVLITIGDIKRLLGS